jgi:hypothetical protein
MKVNVNHPSFISFLDNVSSSVLLNISIDNYFSLSQEKKLGVQYMVFKLTKNSVKLRAELNNEDLKSFFYFLCKKSEDNENYEFSAVLNDILNSFESISEVTKPAKRQNKTAKIDKTKNGE